jgi:hypothetical protein
MKRLLAAASCIVVMSCRADGDAPEPVVWDRDVCAHCRMHIGEPAFAVQVRTRSGEVWNFDDPGCWFGWEVRNRPEVKALWFRDHRGDRWLPAADTAFVRVERTPMGHGLGAVPRATAGALSMAEARAHVTRARGEAP